MNSHQYEMIRREQRASRERLAYILAWVIIAGCAVAAVVHAMTF